MSKKMKSETLSFEQAMEKLEVIVNDLEDGELSLEKSLASFEEGMGLAKQCEKMLNEASGKVEKIMKDFSGDEKRVALTEEEIEEIEEN